MTSDAGVDTEFGLQASAIAARIAGLPLEEQIAAACRGSGNPAALAWIAENLRLSDASSVIDLGAGLGGPSAWMRSRYRCRVVGLEPEEPAAHAAWSLFGIPTIVAAASPTPFAADTFSAALLLGVVSVVPDPESVLTEAGRIAGAIGVLDYCSTSNHPISAGGSTFPTGTRLRQMVATTFTIDQWAWVGVDAPSTWSRAADNAETAPNPDEMEVAEAIRLDRIAPIMLVAHR